jgi:pilus assembly protein CpaC
MSRALMTALPRALRLALVLVSTAAIASPIPVAAQAYGQSSRLMGAPVRQAELGAASYGQTVAVDLSGPSAPVRTLALPRGKSATIDLPTDARDVVLSDPKVADVVLSTPRRIYVVGMGAGQTDAAFMDASGRQILRLNIRVDQDVSALGDTLNRLIPGATIRAEPVNESVVLTGEVPNASAANNAVRLAAAFVSKPEQVVNMLSVTESEQVQLKVRVVEVNRTVIKQLGVNLNALVGQAGSAQFTFANAATWGVNGALLGGLTSGFQGDSTQQPEVKLYDPATNAYDIPAVNRQSNVATTQTTSGSRGLNKGSAILNAFERAGLVRSLAEPDLTVVSGEAGQYLVGGEFPVPVGQDNTGKVTLDYKKYGVGLGYSPVVLSKGRISLKLTAEVSELSSNGAFTLTSSSAPSLVIPGLSVRRVSTTVELPSGQSLMIAGLLQSNAKQTLDSFPGVMNLPILGALFRSRDYVNSETELVVIITPYLVKPVNPNQLQTPADGLVLASDLETTLLGRLNKSFGKSAPPKGVAYQGPIGYVVD